MSSTNAEPNGDPVRRAFAAYYRAEGDAAPIPANTSDVVHEDGRDYVVLRNVNGILAVYRIGATGRLSRMRNWPDMLEVW